MRWKGRRRSSNVKDQRGRGSSGGIGFPGSRNTGRGLQIPSGRRRSGGFGFGTLIVVGLVMWFLGINPLPLLLGGMGGGLSGGFSPEIESPRTQQNSQFESGIDDEGRRFVETILASTEDVWTTIFANYGKRYINSELVLFRGQTQSACGFASSASGPFYCPADSSTYIDLAFYDELANRFGARGDFAQAYVIAHEVGHHVQNIIGILPQFNKMRRKMGKLEANKMTVKVELQADCFAGVWGHYVNKEGWLEEGDLQEALNAAYQVGDDTIQKRTQGYVVPESFNHGTSVQRRNWFSRGFNTGRIEACDTYSAKKL